MSILPSFIRSLLITTIFSFVVPIFLVGGILVGISLIGYLPGLHQYCQVMVSHISQFLATFGSGNSLRGVVVISLTCAGVGALFDTYAFYRHQNLRGD